MALIRRHTHNRVRTDANARSAHIRLRASVAVAARRVVRGRRVAARARRSIASACDVTLIRGAASLGIRTNAHATLTSVRLRARIVVVAAGAVGRRGIAARTGRRTANAHRVTLIRC